MNIINNRPINWACRNFISARMPTPGKNKPENSKSDQKDSVPLRGSFIFANGDKYDGEYIRLKGSVIERQGAGIQQLTNGIVYSGLWNADKINGKGTMKHPNGSSYEGTFLDNEYHGQGMYMCPNGAIIRATFDHNRIKGDGEYTDTEGRIWTGLFANKRANNLHFKIP